MKRVASGEPNKNHEPPEARWLMIESGETGGEKRPFPLIC